MQQIKKIVHAYQGLLISTIMIIVCGAGFLFGIIPLVFKTIDVNTQQQTHTAAVDVLKQKITALQSINEDEIRGNLQTLLSAIPSDKSLATLFSTLDGLSAQTGVSIEDVSLARPGSLATASATRLSAAERAIGSNILPISIHVSGTYDHIQEFLTTSIKIRRLFRVQSFDISFLQNGTPSASMLAATIVMESFYSPMPSSIGSVNQPVSGLTPSDIDTISKIAAMKLLTPAASSPVSPNGASGAVKPDPFSL